MHCRFFQVLSYRIWFHRFASYCCITIMMFSLVIEYQHEYFSRVLANNDHCFVTMFSLSLIEFSILFPLSPFFSDCQSQDLEVQTGWPKYFFRFVNRSIIFLPYCRLVNLSAARLIIDRQSQIKKTKKYNKQLAVGLSVSPLICRFVSRILGSVWFWGVYPLMCHDRLLFYRLLLSVNPLAYIHVGWVISLMLSAGRHVILPSSNLQISNVSEADQGVYQCIAYNPVTGNRVRSPVLQNLNVLGNKRLQTKNVNILVCLKISFSILGEFGNKRLQTKSQYSLLLLRYLVLLLLSSLTGIR